MLRLELLEGRNLPAPLPLTTPLYSANWSGYADSHIAASVSGTWNVPDMGTDTTGSEATWVGLDGLHDGSVEQVGTLWTPGTGYQSWIELYGDHKGTTYNELYFIFLIHVPVAPGDEVTASVTTEAPRKFAMSFTNLTEGGSWSYTVQTAWITPQRSSAEWIVEGLGTLAQYSTEHFTDCYWTTAGHALGIDQEPNYRIYMTVGATGMGYGNSSPGPLRA